MISKATAKFIKSLQLKKFRQQHQAFLVEGAKSVLELLKTRYPVQKIVATDQFIDENRQILRGYEIYHIKGDELNSLGTLKNNQTALAIATVVHPEEPDWQNVDYCLMLDGVNDPGNLGTIIRVADWYGIRNIIVSENTVELHNPKVVNSSKGSFLRVNVFYRELSSFIQDNPKPVIGTFMKGEPIHNFYWPRQGYILMGSEANGITQKLEAMVDHMVTIPGAGEAESLNVGVATAIVCDNWWRHGQ